MNGSVAGVGAYNNLSDQRMKRDIASIQNPIEQLLQIRGVTYEWRRSEYPDIDFPDGSDMGVIAQDVQAVFPQAVSISDKSKTIDQLVEKHSEQQDRIEKLEKQNDLLLERLQAIEKKLNP